MNKYFNEGQRVGFLLTLGLIILLILVLEEFSIIGDNSTCKDTPKHKCTMFVKYDEHYMITPMTWNYRESFKCIECGKDYKD